PAAALRPVRGQGLASLRAGEVEHQRGGRPLDGHRARVLLPRPRVRAGGREPPPGVRREGVGPARTLRRATPQGPRGGARRGSAGDHRAVLRARCGRPAAPRDGQQQPDHGAGARLDHRRPRAPPRRDRAGALPGMTPAIFLFLVAGAAQGDTGSFVIHSFRFASGEVLPELRLHYRTLGQPRRDAAGRVRNAVLVLHGTGAQFLSPLFASELYGAGQPLDTATHYVILPDNVGHGRSSKPSDGLRARFPRYAYEDMVT